MRAMGISPSKLFFDVEVHEADPLRVLAAAVGPARGQIERRKLALADVVAVQVLDVRVRSRQEQRVAELEATAERGGNVVGVANPRLECLVGGGRRLETEAAKELDSR